MVDSNSIMKPINTYTVLPPNLTLVSTQPKVLKKHRNIRGRTRLVTIKQAQSYKTASARFLSTSLHSVSKAITCANSHRIAMYNKKDTACCSDSGSSEDIFPDYSTFKTYHRITNRCATLGNTTKLPIEGIGTALYTLYGRTILTRNALHIPALRGSLYSLCKHHQRPGFGVYSSYKDGSYLFFPDFILQVEDSYDNIVSYRSLGASYKGPIDYIEPKATSYKTMATTSGRPSTITPKPKPQSLHVIPSDDESISSQTSLLPSFNSNNKPQPLIKIKASEPSDAILHKNSIEPLSIRTLNLVHKDSNNLPPIPPSLTPAPCENRTQFESLNIHCIFRCRQFRNQKHLTAATNASLVKSGLLPSNISSFATITNPSKGKPIKKQRQFLDKFHMDTIFDECVALGGHQYALLLFDVATR